MRICVRDQQDFFSGIVFVTIGIAATLGGAVYGLTGSLGAGSIGIGAGYFPFVLGLLLAFVGIFLVARSLVVDGPPISRRSVRAVLMLTAAILMFAILIPSVGLIVAAFTTVLLASLGGPQFRWGPSLVLATIMTIMSLAVFVLALEIPLKIWPV